MSICLRHIPSCLETACVSGRWLIRLDPETYRPLSSFTDGYQQVRQGWNWLCKVLVSSQLLSKNPTKKLKFVWKLEVKTYGKRAYAQQYSFSQLEQSTRCKLDKLLQTPHAGSTTKWALDRTASQIVFATHC
jgi:hypothetical protein